MADTAPWHLQYNRKDCVSDNDSDDDSMTFSSINNPTKERKASVDDFHGLVRWSKLEKPVKKRMSCVVCGLAVTSFEQQTTGIAT
jgi:hypothetical protein